MVDEPGGSDGSSNQVESTAGGEQPSPSYGGHEGSEPSLGGEPGGVNGAANPANEPSAGQPQYVGREDLNKSFQTLQGLIDKNTSGFNEKLEGVSGTLQQLQPLVDLLQANQKANEPDPYRQDPIGKIRETHSETQQLKETVTQLQGALDQIAAEYKGGIESERISREFGKDFNDTTDLERAKALAGTVYKDQFTHLYLANKGNTVQAFGQFLTLLKNGNLNDGGADTQRIVNALSQDKQRAQGAMLQTLTNPQGGVQGSDGKNVNPLAVGALSF